MTNLSELDRRMAAAAEYLAEPTRRVDGRYPIESDPIRRYCHMVDCDSDAFLAPSIGICPPSFLSYFAEPGPWPPSDVEPFRVLGIATTRLNAGVVVEWFRDAQVGESLSTESRYVDISPRPIRLDPDAVGYVLERRILADNGDVVCVQRDRGVAFTPVPNPPTPEPAPAGAGSAQAPPTSTAPTPSGSAVFSIELNARRSVLVVSGSQDLYELHYDPEFAAAQGFVAPVVSNLFVKALIDRFVVESGGESLATLQLKLSSPILVGAAVTLYAATGTDLRSAGLEVWADGVRCASATVTAREGIQRPLPLEQ